MMTGKALKRLSLAVLFFAVWGIRAFAATAMTQVPVADNGTYELAIDGEANTANVHGL